MGFVSDALLGQVAVPSGGSAAGREGWHRPADDRQDVSFGPEPSGSKGQLSEEAVVLSLRQSLWMVVRRSLLLAQLDVGDFVESGVLQRIARRSWKT